MDDPLAVGVVEGLGHPGDQLGGRSVVAVGRREVVLQGGPPDQLAGQVAGVADMARLVDRDDAGMMEPRRVAGLAEEPLDDLVRRRSVAGPPNLERDDGRSSSVSRAR